eukprot:374696-Amphidinium_carterae.1
MLFRLLFWYWAQKTEKQQQKTKLNGVSANIQTTATLTFGNLSQPVKATELRTAPPGTDPGNPQFQKSLKNVIKREKFGFFQAGGGSQQQTSAPADFLCWVCPGNCSTQGMRGPHP